MRSGKGFKNLATKYRLQGEKLKEEGKISEALDSFTKAHDVDKNISGMSFAIDLYMMAGCFEILCNYQKAEATYIEAIAIAESSPDVKTELLIACLNDLALLYFNTAQYNESEKLYKKALNIIKDNSRPLDTENAKIVSHYATLLALKARYAEAENLYTKALKINEAFYKTPHQNVAACLSGIAGIYLTTARYAEAEALYKKALKIITQVSGRSDTRVAVALNNLANLYITTASYKRAEKLCKRALKIFKNSHEDDNPRVSAVINNRAKLLEIKGRYADAEKLYQKALKIDDKFKETMPQGKAVHLNNIADLYKNTGRYTEAKPLYEEVLRIDERVFGPVHPIVAADINNLAGFYKITGSYKKAESLLNKAVKIDKKIFGTEHPEVATFINNLAGLYMTTGRYNKAEPLYEKALHINTKAFGRNHPEVATVINNLGLLCEHTGRYDEAEFQYKSAASINQNVHGMYHPSLAVNLINLAGLYENSNRNDKAKQLYKRVLKIDEGVYGINHPEVAIDINNFARLYQSMGDYSKAESLCKRALEIFQKINGAEHPNVAICLNNLARLYEIMGRHDDAEALYIKALNIAHISGMPNLLWHVQFGLSLLYAKENRIPSSIFFGKQAVNTILGMRRNIAKMGDKILKSFLPVVNNVFKHLADLLIGEGRLPEAEQIMNLMKEQEFFQYVRRDAGQMNHLKQTASLNSVEASLDREYQDSWANIMALRKERDALLNRIKSTMKQKKLLDVLNRKLLSAEKKLYFETVTHIHKELSSSKRVRREVDIELADGLRETLVALGHGSVILYPVACEEAFYLLLVTPNQYRAFKYTIGEKEFKEKISAFRQALQPQNGVFNDPLNLAKELYDIILRPAMNELQKMKAQTLMWSLDGNMRYIPVSALHDGKKYLAETYRNVIFTPASNSRLKDKPKEIWKGLGLGVTKKHEFKRESFTFKALPMVKEELYGIIRSKGSSEGIFDGSVHLDAGFTLKTMLANLKGKYPLVHIASHFQLSPGNETTSFLLLGDGTKLYLDKIKHAENLFCGVDLLTLSACNTAVANAGRDGEEEECLSVIAQNQGAKAILATLWPVADISTSYFMREFYRQRGNGNLKAEALRQAQIAMITGKIKPPNLPWQKSDRTTKRSIDVKPSIYEYETESEAPFAHPYFWAPFILFGNWL
jgi:CHAT domain-containing protein/Tfp pilus assembly protein PilF